MTIYSAAVYRPPSYAELQDQIRHLQMQLADAGGIERMLRLRIQSDAIELRWLKNEIRRLDPKLYKARYRLEAAWVDGLGKI